MLNPSKVVINAEPLEPGDRYIISCLIDNAPKGLSNPLPGGKTPC